MLPLSCATPYPLFCALRVALCIMDVESPCTLNLALLLGSGKLVPAWCVLSDLLDVVEYTTIAVPGVSFKAATGGEIGLTALVSVKGTSSPRLTSPFHPSMLTPGILLLSVWMLPLVPIKLCMSDFLFNEE